MERSISELRPFPDVKLVDKLLDPSWAAQYRERARPPRIEFGTVLLTMTKNERMVAVFHELGHWLRCEHLPRPKNGRKGEEEFAEEFAQYMLQGEAMKRSNPFNYAYFSNLLRGHEGRIRSFARKLIRELN